MELMRKMLRSKIHRATITRADLAYEGSITIPPQLMEAAGLAEYEAVQVWNVNSGARFETYAMVGEPDSLEICVNGAAARLVAPGDLAIIASFTWLPESKIAAHEPRVVFVDENNRITGTRREFAGPRHAEGL